MSDIKQYAKNLTRGPAMAFGFDTKSTPGKIIVHTVQFNSFAIDDSGFDDTRFLLIDPNNDVRLNLLSECLQ